MQMGHRERDAELGPNLNGATSIPMEARRLNLAAGRAGAVKKVGRPLPLLC